MKSRDQVVRDFVARNGGKLDGLQPIVDAETDADYFMLPDFGVRHYSVPDAALLVALDMFSAGSVELAGFEPYVFDNDQAALRLALAPTRDRVQAALQRSIAAKELEAVVLRRSMEDGKAVEARSYVDIDHLIEWLRVHGHERGDFLAEIEQALMEEPWAVASAVARDRFELRFGLPSGRVADLGDAEVQRMHDELHAARIRIAALEQQRDADHRALGRKSRDTLLTIIAALCARSGIDLGRGAAQKVEDAMAKLGLPLGEDRLRAYLDEAAEVVRRRRGG